MSLERYTIEGACNQPQPWNWKNACRRAAGHPGEHHTWDAATGLDRGRHPRAGFVLSWLDARGPVREARMLTGHGAYVAPASHDRAQIAAGRTRRSFPDR